MKSTTNKNYNQTLRNSDFFIFFAKGLSALKRQILVNKNELDNNTTVY